MSAAVKDGRITARNKLVRLLKDLDVRESADDIDDLVDAQRLHADDDDFGQTSKAGDTEEPSDSDDDGDAQGTRESSPYRPNKGVPYERYAVMEKRAVQVGNMSTMHCPF